MQLSILLASVLFLVPHAAADTVSSPTPPRLTYLYSANITLGLPVDLGDLPGKGSRTIFPIGGGEVRGPKITGRMLAIGADWGLNDTRGVYSTDMRAQLETMDGAQIYIQSTGQGQPDGTVHIKASFQTGGANYTWLNDVVAVGVMRSVNDVVAVDMWQMTSPAS
ncbi:hypothetical protein QBC46DRAFT_416194 [Diplogelasinospora grovesii]|uniref:Uncharacterized protein n=1 Tax=Diplogelasinospora grovesii TaxID=303347 RepID=A0AAN6N1H9_9PEZI|nr:hypothetical protein QBC46DRAFT_416194 [Diplogelasinospora grovesii]